MPFYSLKSLSGHRVGMHASSDPILAVIMHESDRYQVLALCAVRRVGIGDEAVAVAAWERVVGAGRVII